MPTTDNAKVLPTSWFKSKFPKVFEKYGPAIKLVPQGEGVTVQSLNEDFLAATLGHLGNDIAPTVFVTREDRFYSYETEMGIYASKSENQIISKLSELLMRCADECSQQGFCDTTPLRFVCGRAGQLNGVIKKAKGQLHVEEDYFTVNLEEFISCSNGMLRLADNELLPFSPTFRRRNKLSVKYDPNAKCPTFLDTLMRQALDDEDIIFLQKWFGLALLGKNISQVIVILTGTAQGGKSTLAKIVGGVIGSENIATLRTEQLGQRFETSSFLGKTLLHGADVQADFLNQKNATALKSLTGGDSMTVELKNGRERPEIVGEFNVLITSNSRLIVRLEGDEEAWRRRLAIVVYRRAKPNQVIPALADIIIKDEGSGVLNWALEGLRQLRADNWHFKLTSNQMEVIDKALLEADSARVFVRECLVEDGENPLLQDDCFQAYAAFCKKREWMPMARAKANHIIEDQIMFQYALSLRHDIPDSSGKGQRGWKGVKIKQ